MKITRVEFPSNAGVVRHFVLDERVAIIDESPSDTELFLSAIRDLCHGVEQRGRVFASVDDTEFELSGDMVSIIGQRLAGAFTVLDPAVPPIIETDPTDIRDVQAVVAQAALETTGAVRPTLDLERLDHASLAIDRYRDPLANDAHAAYLRRTGLLQLFSRRPARELLDPDDPAVAQLDRFAAVLTDRRRQKATNSAPLPIEVDRANRALTDVVSARFGGIPPAQAATMSPSAIAADAIHWVGQQLDRLIAPMVAEHLECHARGIEVVGSIPVFLDLRSVVRFPPGGDAISHAAHREHDLQLIVVPGDEEGRRWTERVLADRVC